VKNKQHSTFKITLIVFAIAIQTVANAQPDFKKLTAAERSQIAEREMLEASRDQDFLRLMDEGHALFVQKHYLKAIRKYEAARDYRPYNVYPKVIITDIELSMKDTLNMLREKETEEERTADRLERKPPPQLPDREKEMREFEEQEKQRMKNVDKWEKNQRRQVADQKELKKEEEDKKLDLTPLKGQDVAVASVEDLQKELAKQYSEGITQRSYDEGTRKVTEHIVVKNGLGNEYKRVEHAWGGKFYFKNGSSISERVWIEETRATQ
jgi:hypothetical protein